MIRYGRFDVRSADELERWATWICRHRWPVIAAPIDIFQGPRFSN